jgi:hypothetical protein
VDLIRLAQGKFQWWVPANVAIINLRVAGRLLASEDLLLHGVSFRDLVVHVVRL